MATRRPIVNVSGSQSELPDGDDLSGSLLAAVAQLMGFSATIPEVEAATRALRVMMRERDLSEDATIGDLVMGRYSMGMVVTTTASTVAIATTFLNVTNIAAGCIAFIKRVSAGAVTTALSGARSGLIKISMRQFLPVVDNDANTQWILPPVGSVSIVSSLILGNPYNGLKTNQPNPMLVMASLPGSLTIPGVSVASKTLGELIGDASAVVGKANIPSSPIFDYLSGPQPLAVGFNSGFSLVVDSPAAATSQSIMVHANIVWDEIQLKSQL